MDLFSAALAGIRSYRGGAAGGMAVFDAQLTLPGPNPGDEQIDVFSTEGPTREYLQRKVGLTRFPWEDRSWNGVSCSAYADHAGGDRALGYTQPAR